MKNLLIAFTAVALSLAGLQACRAMDTPAASEPAATMTASAVFAGGCFWCTESDFEKLPGVIDAISGYTGGHVKDPTYEQVSAGGTGHVEAVKVIYDPSKISYAQLLDWFWRHVDPTDAGGQFVDRGSQYQSEIFYANDEQKQLAEASKAKLEASGRFHKPIVTKIVKLGPFYPAEEYHQDYYKKNPIRYHFYRWNSGRDQFLEKVWGQDVNKLPAGLGTQGMQSQGMQQEGAMSGEESKKAMTNAASSPAQGMAGHQEMQDQPMDAKGMGNQKMADGAMADRHTMTQGMSQPMDQEMSTAAHHERTYTIPDDATLKQTLTPMQYHVTREDGTEPPFDNAYWDNHRPGIYVDVISGEPLFSSTDKFDSGTGWPSFTRPLEPDNVVEVKHPGIFGTRVEVRSKHADSHLGDLFDDGPPPTGMRYCIDSAALRFVPEADLQQAGYGEYLKLFRK